PLAEPDLVMFENSISLIHRGARVHSVLDAFQFVVFAIVEYLLEDNRVLREQIGSRRMRFNDEQRRPLAVKAKKLGRRVLNQLPTIVTPETLLTLDAASCRSRWWTRG